MVDHKVDDLQRMEVITGVGRRRKWPDDFKAKVVAESLEPGVVISRKTTGVKHWPTPLTSMLAGGLRSFGLHST
jgi:hypothetical protein